MSHAVNRVPRPRGLNFLSNSIPILVFIIICTFTGFLFHAHIALDTNVKEDSHLFANHQLNNVYTTKLPPAIAPNRTSLTFVEVTKATSKPNSEIHGTKSKKQRDRTSIGTVGSEFDHTLISSVKNGFYNAPTKKSQSIELDVGEKESTGSKYVFNLSQPYLPVSTKNTLKFNSRGQSQWTVRADEVRKSHKIAAKCCPRQDTWENLSCPHNVRGDGNLVSFWRRPRPEDLRYQSPFLNTGPRRKYVTFEPDVGGWNNIRMQMETVLVFALSTGRTLVMPPEQPLYLLNKGKGEQNHHSFADFFPFDKIGTRVRVVTMEEFLREEAVTGHLRINGSVAFPPGNRTVFDATVRADRLAMFRYLRSAGTVPTWECMKEYLVIPARSDSEARAGNFTETVHERARRERFAATRKAYYYDSYWQSRRVIHFASTPELRLLSHFYTFLFFEDTAADRMVKRFVRDYVHYTDPIFCAAAVIVQSLLSEGKGRFSAFHIRRGEFQYKEVKVPAEEILANVGAFIPKGEVVYVATDERNKTFFRAFLSRFARVKYLDDYFEVAGLHKLNPNFLGMIEAVVCSRGEVFVGTWFSTFSGYITRMRGYLGYADTTVWYGDKKHRDRFQVPEVPNFPFYMREWNESWDGIDDVKL